MVVARIDVRQLGHVVAPPALPAHLLESDVVMQSEVLERRKESLLQRLPESKLDRRPPVEPAAHVGAVGSFGCGGESQQNPGLEVVQEAPIRRCLGMMELVNDHHVEARGIELAEVHLSQGLH